MDATQLRYRQNMPLELKEQYTEARIRDWYNHWGGSVYVSFSGGKDSTVLLHKVRSLYPDVPGVFVDTGLEYPEIRRFVKTFENIVWVKPKMSFQEVINRYGYPVISKDQSCAISRYRNTEDPVQKHRRLNGWPNGKKGMISQKWQYLIKAPFLISDECCSVMKKNPLDRYMKESGRYPMTGMMAEESHNRRRQYFQQGCNAFDNKKPISWPMAFWTEKDIWEYFRKHEIPYCEIYDTGVTRTGCMFCMFGVHKEGDVNRFHRMKETHPKQWEFCIYKLKCGEVLDYIGIRYGSPDEQPIPKQLLLF